MQKTIQEQLAGVDRGMLWQEIEKAQIKGMGEITLTTAGAKLEIYIQVRDPKMLEFITKKW